MSVYTEHNSDLFNLNKTKFKRSIKSIGGKIKHMKTDYWIIFPFDERVKDILDSDASIRRTGPKKLLDECDEPTIHIGEKGDRIAIPVDLGEFGEDRHMFCPLYYNWELEELVEQLLNTS